MEQLKDQPKIKHPPNFNEILHIVIASAVCQQFNYSFIDSISLECYRYQKFLNLSVLNSTKT